MPSAPLLLPGNFVAFLLAFFSLPLPFLSPHFSPARVCPAPVCGTPCGLLLNQVAHQVISLALMLLQPWAGMCQHLCAQPCVPAGSWHNCPGAMDLSRSVVPTRQWQGITYHPSMLPHPFLLSLYFFPPTPHSFLSCPMLHQPWQAPGTCSYPGSYLSPWSKGCSLPRTRGPHCAIPGVWTPACLEMDCLGRGNLAVRMPCTQGETAELPAATAGHCPPTQDRHPSIRPSLPMLLSPVTCSLCPPLCPKSIASVPLPRVLLSRR